MPAFDAHRPRTDRSSRLLALFGAALGVACGDAAGSNAGEPEDLERLSNEIVLSTAVLQPIVAGPQHACAILAGGTLKCWGSNQLGQLGLGDTASRGDAPGEMGTSLPTVPLGTGRTVKAVAMGLYHTCALLDTDQVKCWGGNQVGQLGLGDGAHRGDQPNEMGNNLPPVDLGIGRTAKAIAAGYVHTCALLDDGRIKCWGRNSFGQLGAGDTIERGTRPDSMGEYLPAVSLGTARSARSVACGTDFCCALLDIRQVKCWGLNSGGQLAQGDTNARGDQPGELGDSLAPVGLAGAAGAITAGGFHACALLTNNQLQCWGANQFGQLGLGDTVSRGDDPGEMGPALPVVNLGEARTARAVWAGAAPTAASPAHTCARLDNNQIKCWGNNGIGQLGLGDSTTRGDQPGEMADSLAIVNLGSGRWARAVTAGERYTCAALDTNRAKCWGNNASGRLGLGNTAPRGDGPNEMGDNLPVVNLGSRVPQSVSRGEAHTCAVLNNGKIKCWGSNGFGQLGLENTAARGDGPSEMGDNLASPDLGTNRTAQVVVASISHTCALLKGNRVKCWGRNHLGQLGLGHANSIGNAAGGMGDALPTVDLGSARKAKAIALGREHTCALLDDSTVKCWGGSTHGQLGLGDTNPRGDQPGEMGAALPPVDLGAGHTATAIAAGTEHACAILETGQVKCWGMNSVGQLGLGHTRSLGDGPNEMGSRLPVVNLGTGRTAKAITAGYAHTCALLDNDQVKCWGSNVSGRLGLGDTNHRGDAVMEMGNRLPAVSLGASRFAKAIAAGGAQTCALLDNDQVKCWGGNSLGQLGLSDTRSRGALPGEMGDALPVVALGADRSVVSLEAGDGGACVVLNTGEIKCWGSNVGGQLGLEDTQTRGDSVGEMGASLRPVDLGTDS